MHFPTTILALITLALTGRAAAEDASIHFYSSSDCGGTDDTMRVEEYGGCTQAPQSFSSYDPKDIKTTCSVYSDSSCQNALDLSEKGATTCINVENGQGIAISCADNGGF